MLTASVRTSLVHAAAAGKVIGSRLGFGGASGAGLFFAG